MLVGLRSLWALPVALVGYYIYTKLVSISKQRRFSQSHGCQKIKSAPQKDPFFGIDIFLETEKAYQEKRFLEYVAQHLDAYGPTFKWDLMGDDLIFTNEPRNLQAMLATSFADFDIGMLRQQVSKPFWGVGIFNSDGPFWAHSRALVRPNFTRELIADVRTCDSHVSNLIRQIPGDGITFDLQDLFFRLTLDTSTEHLLGESTNSLQPNAPEDVRHFMIAFEYAQRTIQRRIRMCQYAWLDRDPEFGRACRVAHRYVEPFIQRAISRQQRRSASQKKQPLQGEEQSTHHHPPRRYCLLDELVQQESNPEKIRDQVMNILVAGRDTTASLLSSLFFILARRSDILAKVQDEVAALAGRGAPTYEDIKAMKYLNYVIKETLRLYPPVPLNTRIANKETTLPLGGGPDGRSPIYIHKNQTVVYQVYSTHRRPDFWGLDANEFKPERWYDARVGFEYIPFNAGPRICPGQQFAIVEAAYTAIRLCQSFSTIEARDDGGPWTELLTLTCGVGQGTHVAVKRRV